MTSQIVRIALIAAVAAASLSVAACQPKAPEGDAASSAATEEVAADSASAEVVASEAASS